MNFFGCFLLAIALVLQIIDSNQTNADDTDIKVVLRNGFEEFNNTMANAERIILSGLDFALEVVDSNNTKAQEEIQNTIKEAQNDLYKSGVHMFFVVGKAASNCTNARQSLVQITKNDSRIALNIINTMRTGTTLATQGVNVGGDAAKQLIIGIRKDFQANFGALYKQIPISLQATIQVVSDCNSSMPTDNSNESIQNSGLPSNNNDAEDAISELNEAAANAIQNGADASKVTQLRDLLISSILNLADIASYGRIGFENFKNTVDNDESSAKKSLSEVLEVVTDREITIFVEVCLDIGIVAAKDNLSQEQLQGSYIAAELGIDENVYANMLVENMAFAALQYQGEAREDAYEAVKNIGRYGKMAFMKRIVEAGKDEFNIL